MNPIKLYKAWKDKKAMIKKMQRIFLDALHEEIGRPDVQSRIVHNVIRRMEEEGIIDPSKER